MSKSETKSRCFAHCRSCGATVAAEIRPDGTIRPIGVSPDCSCGDGDFERVLE